MSCLFYFYYDCVSGEVDRIEITTRKVGSQELHEHYRVFIVILKEGHFDLGSP